MYSSANDDEYEMMTNVKITVIVTVLFCAPLLALVLKFLICCIIRLFRRYESLDGWPETSAKKMNSTALAVLPTLVFSTRMELAGAEAICAICLSEFVDGERVKVLPRCKHGFHVQCVETWLAAHSSCPVCRASWLDKPLGKYPRCETNLVIAENLPEMVP